MSSQIKIILKDLTTDFMWTGSQAIAVALQKYIAPQILKIAFPMDWVKLTKIQKLRFLMTYAPKNLELKVIQQRRGMKASKSLYQSLKAEHNLRPIGNGRIVQQDVEVVEQRLLDQIIDEDGA
jgi:hypothetical protein